MMSLFTTFRVGHFFTLLNRKDRQKISKCGSNWFAFQSQVMHEETLIFLHHFAYFWDCDRELD